ncbi:DUF4365 domain-containing protein [Rhodococcus ruber]|uniref:DUF4365 domain-containing protein n=1 Tax=Rhodococcus ruber TaxID=1830 RepID=UPI000C7A438F|nr:DUF4365 domain-containing protein [Rhodococcus ruber]AUM17399.1 hypothetical protein CSW53_13255 [Rhodococcus ruber]
MNLHPVSDFGLGIDQSKSRYSLSYLYSLCAHAGCAVKATEQDSDVHAIDATVEFEEADVRVQLKCTESPKSTKSGFTVSLEDSWIRKWQRCHIPVYVVLVVVPKLRSGWVDYRTQDTVHNTHAYWERFDKTSTAKSIHIPIGNRFQSATLEKWHADLSSEFGAFGEEVAS